ncbi:MAG: pyridoxal 5'-phosphate synthase glutaminase subunit PdxT [Bryobacterales bacterium]|nr:pyridoxal 5'-phosphate synthase glutaminase subunit PdxT [Bryobacterales bacterium]
MKRVGILALQGDFEAHGKALARAGAGAVFVRTAGDLEGLDGLIIPGGESTTMLKLLREEKLMDPLAEFGRRRPVFGTCAGAILLAREVSNPVQDSLALMDIAVERNAYGRQLESHVSKVQPDEEFARRAGAGEMEAVFIRAPIIRRVGESVRVLARSNGDPVLVEQGPYLVATFHPELTVDSRVHRLFLSKLSDGNGARR